MMTKSGTETPKAHTFNRQCPACKGLCVHVKVNSLVPYEEIEAEILRRRRLDRLGD